MPYFSIIIPIYNVEVYLEECLKSVINQSFTDCEVICINDGSTDGSREILERYALEDRRIRVIDQDNAGLSVARNSGIAWARGRYICFVDADDLIASDLLQTLWHIVETGDYDIVTYELRILMDFEDDEIKTVREEYYRIKKDYSNINDGRELFCKKIENGDYIDSASQFLIKREWLEQKDIHFMPCALYEDSVFSLKCHFACDSIRHIHKVLYTYRIRRDSITTKEITARAPYYRFWQIIESFYLLFESAESDRERKALTEYARTCLECARREAEQISVDLRSKAGGLPDEMRLAFDILGIDMYASRNDWHPHLDGLLRQIENYNEIIIYGFGVVGKKVESILSQAGYSNKIIGFAVTDEQNVSKADNRTKTQVLPIKDYKKNTDAIVLISVGRGLQQTFVNKVIECGFKHFYVINREIEWEIESELGN